MKKSISKKLLSLFLALMMVVTSVPMFAMTAFAADANKFLFAYFTGDSATQTTTTGNQSIRFAVSNDAKSYSSLNDGNAVIKQSKGSFNARDPYIFRGQDGLYYAIATDADCSNGWWGNSNSFVFWTSKDLVTWENETIIKVNEIIGKNVHRAWAPQVMYDASVGKYMVYFALAADGYALGENGYNTHMYYMYADNLLDQNTYSKVPVALFENTTTATKDTIDGDITYSNGKYYMFYKNEAVATISVATSDTLTGPYSNPITLDTKTYYGSYSTDTIGALEGCQVFRNNAGEYIFMADRFKAKGSFAVYNFGTDLAAYLSSVRSDGTLRIAGAYDSTASDNISKLSPRHGSVLQISDAEYNTLMNASANKSFNTVVQAPDSVIDPPPAVTEKNNGIDLSDNLIARYFVYDTTTDESVHDYKLSNAGSGASWSATAFDSKGAAYFSPDNYMYTNQVPEMLADSNGDKGLTFSFYGNVSSEGNTTVINNETQYTGRFFEMNNMGTKGSITYDVNHTSAKYISMKAPNSSVELSANYNNWDKDNGRWAYGSDVIQDISHLYTVTVKTGELSFYLDGVQKYTTIDRNTITDIINTLKTKGYLLIGGSGWGSDNTYSGYIRDFRIYNRAITADEAAKLNNQYSYDNYSDKDYSDLRKLLDKYEKMINGTVYTNMQPAYDAYVKALAAYDAYYYGGRRDIDLNSLYIELDKAVNRMEVWTQYTGTVKARFENDKADIEKSNGLIYSATQHYNLNSNDCAAYIYDEYQFRNAGSNSSKGSISFGIYQNATVALYDGKTPINIPVLACIENTNHGGTVSLYNYSVYPTNANFTLSNNVWKGGVSDVQTFNAAYTSDTKLMTSNQNISSSNYENYIKDTSSTHRYYANIISVDGSTFFPSGTTNHYKLLDATTWNLQERIDARWGLSTWKNNANGTSVTKSVTQNTTLSPIYVVNYKPVVDEVDRIKAFMPSSIEGFKEGGLSEFLAAFDTATGFNPNNSFTKVENLDNSVKACAADIENVIKVTKTITSSPTPNGDGYKNLRTAMDKYLDDSENYLNKGYTETSVAAYKDIFKASQEIFADVYDNKYDHGAWAANNAEALEHVLNYPLNLDALVSVLNNKGIFDNEGNQIYTYSSWKDNKQIQKGISDYSSMSSSGKHPTTDSTYSTLSGTEVGYAKVDYTKNNQTIADQDANDIGLITLDRIDLPEKYDSFDAADVVVRSVEPERYTQESYEAFVEKVNEIYNTVYITVSQDDADRYNNVTTGARISATDILKGTALNTTDDQTKALLEAVNTILVPNEYNSYLIIQDDQGNVSQPITLSEANKKYGEMFTFDVTTLAGENSVTWSATLYNKGDAAKYYAGESVTPIATQKVSDYYGTVLERKADCDIIVTAQINTSAKADGVVLRVYNGYNNLVDVIYESDIDSAKAKLPANPVMPFLTFTGWSITQDSGSNVYYAKPVFDVTPTVEIKHADNVTVSGNKCIDDVAQINSTVTVSTRDKHIGWAVETEDGKYQIVSYSTGAYKFSAIASEKYVPIVAADEGYVAYYGLDESDEPIEIRLTPDNVDGFKVPVEVSTINAQIYLNTKLKSKDPFVYVQKIENTTADGKVKVFARVTSNGDESQILAYGLRLTKASGQVGTFASTTKNTAGQFYMTMSPATFAALSSVEAYVTFDFEYTYGDKTASITTTEYALYAE